MLRAIVAYDTRPLQSSFVLDTTDYRIEHDENKLVIYIEYCLHGGSEEPALLGDQVMTIAFRQEGTEL